MSDSHRPKRSIILTTDGIARLIGEFNSHLALTPRVLGPRPGKPIAWDEGDLRRIRESVRNPQTGIVDIESHIRQLVLYTEIPDEVIRNISQLALGRIAQKLLVSKGALAFRHGTFLRVESNPAKAAELFGSGPSAEMIVVNVWTPKADLSAPPSRRVPLPVFSDEGF
jgi:hypothetical protein